jgi:predicted ATPase
LIIIKVIAKVAQNDIRRNQNLSQAWTSKNIELEEKALRILNKAKWVKKIIKWRDFKNDIVFFKSLHTNRNNNHIRKKPDFINDEKELGKRN